MNKYTLVIMAALCVLLTSCTKEELNNDNLTNTSVSTRSVTDPIKISFVAADGLPVTVYCTSSTVSYQTATQSVLKTTVTNGATTTYLVTDIDLETRDGYRLQVSIDNNTAVETADISIDHCGTELCYVNVAGDLIGSASEFIIEDEPTGF